MASPVLVSRPAVASEVRPRPAGETVSAARAPTPLPRVSVVIPLYNKKGSIGRALQSVLNQSIRDFEVIVIDDGSQDGSGDVVAAIADRRIRLFRQENQGVSVARNNGILRARSEVVALLDADDEWAPNFLEATLGVLDEDPEARVVGAFYRVQKENGVRNAFQTPEDEIFAEGESEARIDFFRLGLDNQPLHSSSVVIRRSVFASCGLFPPGVTHGEDLDMWGRLGLACGERGVVLTRRTWSVWRTDSEARACLRRSKVYQLPLANLVLNDRRSYPVAVREWAHFMLLRQARQLRLSGHRWVSLLRIWKSRRTHHHRRLALREFLAVFLDPRALPSS